MIESIEEFEQMLEQAKANNTNAQYEVGLQYISGQYAPKSFEHAMHWLKRASGQGHAQASLSVANLFTDAMGVENGAEFACKYFALSGEQGCPTGFFNLGVLFYNGIGVSRDYDKALMLMQKASNMGDVDATAFMGIICLRRGYGNADYAKAVECFTNALAKDSNHINAIYNLATCYAKGLGTNKDLEKAKALFQKGADLLDDNCKNALIAINNGTFM